MIKNVRKIVIKNVAKKIQLRNVLLKKSVSLSVRKSLKKNAKTKRNLVAKQIKTNFG
jgi:hypothetical protein